MVISIFEMAGVQPTTEEKASVVTPKVAPAASAPVTTPKREVKSIYDVANTIKRPYLRNQDILANPTQMKSVRDYMTTRMGDYYKTASNEDVLDDWVDHMRWVNTNEVNTVGEARNVLSLEEKDKPVYADAYRLYDEMGSAYQAGGGAELLDAVGNYTGAVLSSPSTWIGGFVGRALSKPATKLVAKATQEALKTGVKEGVETVAKKEVIKKAAKAVEKQVTKTSGIIAGKASRQELVTAAVIGTAFDSTISGAQEALRQRTLVDVGAQKEIDRNAIALNTVFGVIGGGFAYFPHAMRGTVKLGDAGGKMRVAKALRAKEARAKIGTEVEDSVKRLVTDWDAIAKHGQEADAKKFLRDQSLNWFFDVDNEKSFVRILQKLGADLGADEKTFSHKIVEYARGLPPQNRAAITKSLKPLGVNFGEMIDIFAGAMKEGGESLSKASQAKRFYDDFQNVSVKKQQAIRDTLSGEGQVIENAAQKAPPEVIKYATSVWKRLLVSHIATTMVNVKGWGLATAARTMSEMLHGGVLGSVGLAQKLMGSAAADKTLAKSSAMFKSNLLLVRSLVDPYTSAQGFFDLLDNAPKTHKRRILETFSGGVGDEGPELFKVNPNNKFVKLTENYVDLAARISFVRTQDIYTKAFSGLKELDKITRIETGVGVEELLAKGKTHLIPEEAWERATKALLEDTYSVNYTKGHSIFNKMAKMVEGASNTPGVGFILPFGRFINNVVGFSYQYSPFAFAPMLKYLNPKIKIEDPFDLGERLSKAIVGTTALVMLTSREEEKQKEGLQWNEERTSDGDIQDVSNFFPLSLYNLAGRVIVDLKNGSGVPPALWDELKKQIGPLSAVEELTGAGPLTNFFKNLSEAEEPGQQDILMEVGALVIGMLSGVAAGYTRPFDPVNDLLGVSTDLDGITNDATPDRKMAEGSDKILQNFSRYTSTFFNLLLGEDTGDGKFFGTVKKSATEEKPLRDPNPISRLAGAPLKNRQDSIDIILGMVDLAPYRMDSLTTGVPEYDDFINGTIFPILERKAEAMLSSDLFMSRPKHIQREMVSKMLSESRKEVLDGLENGSLTNFEDYTFNERRKFMSLPQSYRAEAKKALRITTEDRDLSAEEVEMLQLWIEINKELDDEMSSQY